LNISTEAVNAT